MSNSRGSSLGEKYADDRSDSRSTSSKEARVGDNGASFPYRSPGEVRVGGDWSNAAFWLCADALPGCAVNVTGLDESSAQGDRRVAEELRRMRAGETLLDAADIPDLVPILAATACARGQALRVIRAGRLRIKESDRLASVSRTLRALGGDVTETEDGLIVAGKSPENEAPSPIDLRIHTDPVHTCDADAYWPGFTEEGAANKPELREKALSAIDSRTCDAGTSRPDFAEGGATGRPEIHKRPSTAIDPHTHDADARRPSFAEDSAASEPDFGEEAADSIQLSAPEMRQTLADASTCPLTGGAVDACGDHRIAMMAAIASCACANEVVVRGAEAVNKSYPGFWRDFAALGGCVELTEE